MTRFPHVRGPDDQTLAWVLRATGAHRVARCRRLTGGITSTVHEVTVEASSRREHVVLRRWTGHEASDAAGWVRNESSILDQLARTPIPAPELIASDPGGEHTSGVPALLMSRRPGRLDLAPSDPDRFIGEMARHLARIHDARVTAPDHERAVVPSEERIPTRTTSRDTWLRALEVMRGPRPEFVPRFVHRDYQHFNMLWSRGRITGVLDWPFSSSGPPAIDVGHCRLNLAVLFSTELAERFGRAYETETGCAFDPWYDIHAIWSFNDSWHRFIPRQVAGRTTVDHDGMDARVDALLASALRRV